MWCYFSSQLRAASVYSKFRLHDLSPTAAWPVWRRVLSPTLGTGCNGKAFYPVKCTTVEKNWCYIWNISQHPLKNTIFSRLVWQLVHNCKHGEGKKKGWRCCCYLCHYRRWKREPEEKFAKLRQQHCCLSDASSRDYRNWVKNDKRNLVTPKH